MKHNQNLVIFDVEWLGFELKQPLTSNKNYKFKNLQILIPYV